MLHELHESETSFRKEQTVLEQCEQLSSRLKEALQAHKQDRYNVHDQHVLPSCYCVCAPVVHHLPVIAPLRACSMTAEVHDCMRLHDGTDPLTIRATLLTVIRISCVV